jgi:hypothetical protein
MRPPAQHSWILQLPEGIDHRFPIDFFMLFFTMLIFETLRENTNKYVIMFFLENGIHNHRTWVPVTIDEIRMFLAIVIYIGL